MADATVRAAGSYTTGALDEPRTDVGYSGVGGKFDTDDRGRFRIPGLSEHSLVDLLVAAPGFATEQLLEVPPTESAPVEVALEPEAVIAGRVTFRGHGVAAWLEVFRETGDTGLSTDEEGRFRTRGLAAGRYNLVAHAQDTQVFTNARTGARSVNRLSTGWRTQGPPWTLPRGKRSRSSWNSASDSGASPGAPWSMASASPAYRSRLGFSGRLPGATGATSSRGYLPARPS